MIPFCVNKSFFDGKPNSSNRSQSISSKIKYLAESFQVFNRHRPLKYVYSPRNDLANVVFPVPVGPIRIKHFARDVQGNSSRIQRLTTSPRLVFFV